MAPSPEPTADNGAGPLSPKRQAVYSLALLSLVLCIAALSLFKMSNNDIWIHLKTGEKILSTGTVPHNDPYSFIASDHEYVAHEWLSGVLFYLVYAVAGVNGLIFFKFGIIAASCAFLYGAARMLGARLSVILPAFAFMLYISSARYLERPHVFSYLMSAVYLWLFFRYRQGGRNRMFLYAIPAAHALWTNLHGGYVQGLAMIATFALGETIIWARTRYFGLNEENSVSTADLRLLWLLIPISIAASLINPYGYKLLLFPFQLTGMETFMANIYEWQPPNSPSYSRSTMFFFYLIELGWLVITFFICQRDRKRSRGGGEALGMWNIGFVAAASLVTLVLLVIVLQDFPASREARVLEVARIGELLRALLVLFAAYSIFNLRSVDFTQTGIFMLMLILSLRHNRAVTDAAMTMYPILAASASNVFRRALPDAGAAPRPRGKKRREPKPLPPSVPAGPALPIRLATDPSRTASVLLGSLLLIGISFHVFYYTYFFDFNGASRQKGFGIAENMPVCAVDFIEEKNITGQAFVSYPLASMLIHRMYPSVKVNMDSRNDVYGETLYKEYMSALRDPDRMNRYLEEHHIDFFLLSLSDRLPAVFSALEATGEWAYVYFDDRNFILLRRKPETEELIRYEEFNVLKPAVMGGTTATLANAGQLLEEAERAIGNCTSSVFAYFHKSNALKTFGRFEEALEPMREVLSRDPDNVHALAGLGYIYASMREIDKAIEMYERALAINPGYQAARQNLERLKSF